MQYAGLMDYWIIAKNAHAGQITHPSIYSSFACGGNAAIGKFDDAAGGRGDFSIVRGDD